MRWLPRILLAAAPFALGLPTLSARIGDSKSELESRLTGSGRGMRITDGDLAEFHIRRSPIASHTGFSREMEIEVYYKLNTDVIPSSIRLWQLDDKGRQTEKPVESPEGWLLHVVYLNGVSVLEYYRRSQSITVVEMNGILALNQGQSEWRQGRVPKDDEEAIQPKTFPHNHHRADFAIYANVAGDTLLLFDPRLDEMIQDEELRRAREQAPNSLDGF